MIEEDQKGATFIFLTLYQHKSPAPNCTKLGHGCMTAYDSLVLRIHAEAGICTSLRASGQGKPAASGTGPRGGAVASQVPQPPRVKPYPRGWNFSGRHRSICYLKPLSRGQSSPPRRAPGTAATGPQASAPVGGAHAPPCSSSHKGTARQEPLPRRPGRPAAPKAGVPPTP